MTIIERSSGFWMVDQQGVVKGPFLTWKKAMRGMEKLKNGGR